MLHGVHAAMYHREGARSPSSSRPPRQNQRDGVDGSYLYNVLGILKSADQNQIRKAYKKKAMMFHPDKGGDLTRVKCWSSLELICSSTRSARRTRFYQIQKSEVNTMMTGRRRL